MAPSESGQERRLLADRAEDNQKVRGVTGRAGEYQARKNLQCVLKPGRDGPESDQLGRIFWQVRTRQEAPDDRGEELDCRATVGGESGASTGAVRLSLGGAVSALTGLSAAAWPGVPVSDGGLVGIGSMLLSPRDLSRSGLCALDVETGEMSGSRHPP